MTILDVVLLFIVFGFAWYGFLYGVLRALGGVIGLVFGFYLAGVLTEPIAPWLGLLLNGDENMARIIVFVLIFVIINRFAGFVFYLLDRIFKIVSWFPFIKSINRLAGLILGLTEGIFLVGGALLYISKFVAGTPFESLMTGSDAAFWLVKMAGILMPLLPDVLEKLPDVFSQAVDRATDVIDNIK